MHIVDGRRVLAAERRGSSWPVLVDTDAGVLFTKLRGAAQGPGALVAEVIVAELAESLGLRVPPRMLVKFAPDIESADQNDELADLLRASEGINLGFAHLDGAVNFVRSDVERVPPEDAAAILWLDGLTANPDRTARNPNLLWWRDELWLIDHGAALAFQYALPDMDASAPRRPYLLREPHLLQTRAGKLAAHDTELASRVTQQHVVEAVAAVPDEFLAPLLHAPRVTRSALRERRAAYVEYLSRRLEAPRPFLEPAVAPSNQQPRRGRPAWLARGR